MDTLAFYFNIYVNSKQQQIIPIIELPVRRNSHRTLSKTSFNTSNLDIDLIKVQFSSFSFFNREKQMHYPIFFNITLIKIKSDFRTIYLLVIVRRILCVTKSNILTNFSFSFFSGPYQGSAE